MNNLSFWLQVNISGWLAVGLDHDCTDDNPKVEKLNLWGKFVEISDLRYHSPHRVFIVEATDEQLQWFNRIQI
jgi:hypothetical protein